MEKKKILTREGKCHRLTNQWQLRNQHLDCKPLSGWERIGRLTDSLKRNSCKLQIGKPLWEAALPFVVSFLLSSKCWHADVSSHSSYVITKIGECHKGMILQHEVLYCMQHTREGQPPCFIYGNITTVKGLAPCSFGEASKPSPTWCTRQDNLVEKQSMWPTMVVLSTFHSSGRALLLCLCAERRNGAGQIRILIRACAGVC